MSNQTPEQRIDAALDSVLRASGSALRHYTLPKTLTEMRETMRKIMSDSYIAGVHSVIGTTRDEADKYFEQRRMITEFVQGVIDAQRKNP